MAFVVAHPAALWAKGEHFWSVFWFLCPLPWLRLSTNIAATYRIIFWSASDLIFLHKRCQIISRGMRQKRGNWRLQMSMAPNEFQPHDEDVRFVDICGYIDYYDKGTNYD